MVPRITLWLLVILSTFLLGCSGQVRPEAPAPEVKATPVSSDPATLCESIRTIEVLPNKDEPVPDPVYNGLIAAGENAIPCLIRKITDQTPMKDPRSAPKVGFVSVGDTAFFVLVGMTKINFADLLPPDVRRAYESDEGVYGYFRTINQGDNRQQLQAAAVKWYEKKYRRSLP